MTIRLFVLARMTLAVALLTLAGCASIPADRGFDDVQTTITARGIARLPAITADGPANELIDQALSKPVLELDDALHIALLANPMLREEYARLGLSAAEVYNAGRLSNPTLSASILFGGGHQTTLGIAQNFADLLLLPARKRVAAQEFEQIKLTTAQTLVKFTRQVAADYYRAVAATQSAQLRDSVAKAGGASAELAQRFFDAGNINRLELDLSQAEAAQAQLDALTAQAERLAARAALRQRLGLTAERDHWQLAKQLPEPVAHEDELSALQALAQQRLDLLAAEREVATLEDAYGISRRNRYLNEAELGVETERDNDGSRMTGPTASIQLPLFNRGQGNILRAQAQLELRRANRDALRTDISNAVQLGHAHVAQTRAVALNYQQTLIPLRASILAQTQRHANYMLIGQFELIRAKQQQYDTYQKAFEAVRDYWLARVELASAVGSALPSDAHIQSPTSAGPVVEPNAAQPAAHSHHH